jgi:hypothetical protein
VKLIINTGMDGNGDILKGRFFIMATTNMYLCMAKNVVVCDASIAVKVMLLNGIGHVFCEPKR